MGKQERVTKDKQRAAMMKEQGITRRTAACPNHCGAQVPVGGNGLIVHLNRCGRGR